MRRTALRPYAAGLALVVGLGLAGCTGDDPASQSTPPSSATPRSTSTSVGSPSTSTTSPADPTSGAGGSGDVGIPAAARAQTSSGAEAFTTYFFGRLNAGYSEARVAYLDPLVLPTCKTCAGFRTTVATLAKDGQHYVGDFATPTTVTIATFSPPTAKTFVSTRTPRHTVVDSSGKTVDTIEAGALNVSVFLEYDGQWRVSEIKTAA